MKTNKQIQTSILTPSTIYAVQILIGSGDKRRWEWAPPLYGMDVTTEIIGGHFLGSLELARSEAERNRENRRPETVRIIQYVLTKWSEHY